MWKLMFLEENAIMTYLKLAIVSRAIQMNEEAIDKACLSVIEA